MNDDLTVMVGWRKGWASASHTYLVEIGDDSVWLGRLGSGGADWGTSTGSLADDSLRQASRGSGGGVAGGVGMSLGRAAARKVLDKYRSEIATNVRRYRLEGRAALADDKHTTEWPLADFSDARIVKRLPLSGPKAVQSLGPAFVTVTLGGKRHFFGGLPGGTSAEDFHASLVAAIGSGVGQARPMR